jgi:hypothetical protein
METGHKEALAIGRTQGKVVRDYLKALDTGPTRKTSVDALHQRLEKLDATLAETNDPVRKMLLTQTRFDLLEAIEQADSTVKFESLQKEFVQVAADYAARRGISYQAFREVGVPAAVLKEAGIRRSA